MVNLTDLVCPFCEEKNNFVITKQNYLGYDEDKSIDISAHLYILKCGKCDKFITTVPQESIKAVNPSDQGLLD